MAESELSLAGRDIGRGYGLGDTGYGGGGYLQEHYDGLVECCQKVVDPFILLGIIAGIAGLTYFLRQQVLASITGRAIQDNGIWEIVFPLLEQGLRVRVEDQERLNLLNRSNDIDVDSPNGTKQLDMIAENHGDKQQPAATSSCHMSFGICLLGPTAAALKASDREYAEVMSGLGRSLGEYLTTGQVMTSLHQMWQLPHIRRTHDCIAAFHTCSD